MQRIADLNYEFPEDFPDEARDLVAQLLVEEPTDRLGYRSIQEIKDHAFFRGAVSYEVPLRVHITVRTGQETQPVCWVSIGRPDFVECCLMHTLCAPCYLTGWLKWCT